MIPSCLGGMAGFLLLLSWSTFQIVAGIFPAFMPVSNLNYCIGFSRMYFSKKAWAKARWIFAQHFPLA